jgi:hypothetical protein
MRRNTTPVSTGAGFNTIRTFLPECRPTPLARMGFFKVRCRSMGSSSRGGEANQAGIDK